FLTGLRGKTATATVAERQRVLRLLVKDVFVGPDKITIRHSIPVRHNANSGTDDSPETDPEGEIAADSSNCVGGVSGPPCGVPDTSRCTDPSCITPARSITRSSFNTPWSLTRSSIACINFSCGIAEKQLAMSVSTTHRLPCQDSSMSTCSASCVDRFGRNPKLHDRNPASKIGSST